MSRLIESLNEQQALNKCADGYEVYWTENNTYLTASHLREIADELDRRNAKWHKRVMNDVGIPMPDTVCTDFQPDWTLPISEYKRIQEESMPKIKPLVWLKGNPQINEWIAETPLGKFRVLRKHPDSNVTIYMAPFHWDSRSHFGTINEAKQVCQSEYERRVRECLM